MNRRVRIAASAGGLVLLVGIVWRARPKPAEVETVPVRTGTVEATVSAVSAGTIEARESSDLYFQIPGAVASIRVREGDRVRSGAVLVALENTEARVNRDTTLRNYERGLALHHQRLLSDRELDAMKSAAELAQAAYDKTQLKAPFDGLVTQVHAHPGELVLPQPVAGPLAAPIVQIIDDSELDVRADIDEVDSVGLRLGERARLTLDAVPGRSFEGRVTEIAPAVATALDQSRTVQVKVTVLPDPALRVGMSADVEIITGEAPHVLLIPSTAVLDRDHKKLVYVDDDGKARTKDLEIGLANWEVSEVRSGLREGEQVILPSDAVSLKDGLRVRAKARRP